AFWTERDALARDLLRDHHDTDALVMADDAYQTDPAVQVDGAFLTGWISLRRLHDPAGAEAEFSRLLSSTAAITRSRGDYWLGRARLARGDMVGGRAALAAASAFPTTFYGQLAIARLQDPAPGLGILLDPSLDRSVLAPGLSGLHDPHWTSAQAIGFAGLELARAAETLVAWNDPKHARAFLLKLDQSVSSDIDHALAASLAVRLGLPDVAVAIARSAGRHGLVLADAGWPRPYSPPPAPALPAGLALAVMRQESSFDPQIASPAGARGLMQLTSGTARDTARGLGRPDLSLGSGGASLFDPDVNLTLGTAYLGGLMTRFGNVAPYAIAAYNAGPHRVDRWLVENGDATVGTGDADDAQTRMVDWIEMIPFSETRNYVQRVIENMGVYQNDPGGRA
ncbi:MAG: lytic transglycosylase domain-containing protein, partial [Janthinobacterium lividum]